MITYNITTNFGAKDALPQNDPDKIIQGADHTVEYEAIQTAFVLAAPAASPTFTGVVTSPSFVGPLTGDVVGNVIGDLTGNASTATAWATPRTLTFTGDATGTVTFDGSSDESVAMTVAATSHTHSTFDNSTPLTGANVYSNVTVADGITTALTSRVLTLAELGFTGDSDANTYVHPSHAGDDFSIDTGALTGATVISDIDINLTSDTLGHVTDANATVATRTLTTADIGALKDTTDTFTGTLSVTGSVVATADITAYSDMTLKQNIEPLHNAGERLNALGGYSYNRTDMDDLEQVGLMAQEVKEVLPEAVKQHGDGKFSVNYNSVIALMVEAVNELSEKVAKLESK